MSKIQVDTIDTRSGTATMTIGSTNTTTVSIPKAVTLGASGTTVTIPSGATITNSGTSTGFGEDNTPYFSANGSSTQTVSNSTDTQLQFNQLIDSLDSASGYDTSAYTYTVQSGGAGLWYLKA